MASDLETKAKEEFIDDHFELSVELYTQAIALSPKKAELYVDRAQANIKLGQYTEAVADANKAIELDPSNSKAYLRKGTACLKLEEYQTAKVALETGSAMASGDSRFTSLIKECEKFIAGHSQFFQFMDVHIFIKEEMGNPPQVPVEETVQETVLPTDNVVPVSDQLQQAKIEDKPKFRHEFYQKPEEVVVTILAKGIPAGNVAVEFGEQILSVTIDLPGEDAYFFQPRLFGKIIREKCKYFVLSTKIEIRLAKAEQIHWTTLEFSKENRITQSISVPASGSQRPSYPSSKPKRDWDKIEAEVKKEEKDEKLDGDAALNKFFREIYKDADEDTRRAMQKSFVESNGTVLSTNWKEVGSKKVEGSPPDGMELKKWEI